jgi:tRNA threonylcarbamoyl adenosine modification protein (Sua5/YciO/YrdC/YwlC family)
MALYLRIFEENPNSKEIAKAVKILKNGGIIIYPTDTVYGLGCDIMNVKAIEKLAQLKSVKVDKADFSFVCHDLSNLSEYVKQIDTATYKILRASLPGAYTFILPANNNIPSIFKKKKTVGIRVPSNEIARTLARELGNPLISTSLLDEDEILEYTTDPELIYEKWQNQVDLIIDGGYGKNQPSTVIDLSVDPPVIVRVGVGPLNLFKIVE